jgi:hypothetical protein
VRDLGQLFSTEPLDLGLPIGLRFRHALHDGTSSLVRKAARSKAV